MKTLVLTFRKWRGRYRKVMRLIYMSPAERRFIELMGGQVYTITKLTNRSGFPATIVLSKGPVLKAEKFKREVRYGKYFVDFANDLNRIIEIDGHKYHMDVVADMDREIYIKEFTRKWQGYDMQARILRIPAYRVFNSASRVQSDVLKFLQE